MKISQSEVARFRNCQYAHDLRYNRKLVPASQKGNAAFLGTTVHLGLEIFFKHIQENGWDSYKEAAKKSMLEISMKMGQDPFNAEYYARALVILKNYFEYYQDDKNKYEVIATEQEFEYTLGGGLKMGLRIDLLVHYVTGPLKGRVVMRDGKTAYDFWSDHKRTYNTQFPVYMWVLNQLFNYDMEYMELDQYRTRPLKKPLFSDLFQRDPLYFPFAKQEQTFKEFVQQANEIKFRRQNPGVFMPTRNPDFEWCKTCEFRQPCELKWIGREEEAEDFLRLEFTDNDPYSYGELL